MFDPNPLLVPIELDALVVNTKSRIGQNFRRWRMSYNSLTSFASAEPPPFSANEDDFSTASQNEGVYLLWTLPDALRHGTQNPATGELEFPLVPNRWLVVRFSGEPTARVATAWVIESDVSSNHGAGYIDPQASQPAATLIGNPVPHTASRPWSETRKQQPLYLTALGPGNALFSVYQPHNTNVFSFHDDLSTPQVITKDTLSYLIVGWYSDTTRDILSLRQSSSPPGAYADTLADLRWSARDKTLSASQSVYHGLIYDVDWDVDGDIPPSARDTTNVSVAVGNSSIDALAALLKLQGVAIGNSLDSAADLLEAFQHGLLSTLDQPGGEATLYEKIHQAWFGSKPGGTLWEIVDVENDPSAPPPLPLDAEELARESAWLAELNRKQAELDLNRRTLHSLQRDLFEMWWKQGWAQDYFNSNFKWPYGTSADQFAAALQPAGVGQASEGGGSGAQSLSLTEQVKQQYDKVRGLEGGVPLETADTTLEESAAAYAQARSISPLRQLKAAARARFWHPNDPVVLIAGAHQGASLDAPDPLPCRYPRELVTGFTFNHDGSDVAVTAAALGGVVPSVDTTNFPPVTTALLQEFFLLDPANAPAVANQIFTNPNAATVRHLQDAMKARTSYNGRLPPFGLTPWSQPWLPLYMEWVVDWYAIPYGAGGAGNWLFDGMDYQMAQAVAAPPPVPVGGRAFLTPKTSQTFKAQLEQLLASNAGDERLAGIDKFVSDVDDWDFISQALSGFNDQIALRDPLANVSPDEQTLIYQPDFTTAKLVGDQALIVPQSILPDAPHHGTTPAASTFEAMRNGHFLFQQLTIVDRFGQTIEVINANNKDFFHPVTAAGLLPDEPVLSTEPLRLVQLPPRLLQAGRLDFSFVSTTDDTVEISQEAGANPICGWVLPNHLDRGLAVFDPAGRSLGEMRAAVGETQGTVVVWQPSPGSLLQDLAAFAQQLEADASLLAHKHLAAFLLALQAQTAQAFNDFLTAIDETTWTIDPLGSRYDQYLSVLIGRPLALVRARLQFELEQTPLLDPAWPYTFNPQTPLFTGYSFDIKLGNQGYRQDGLIGYFLNDDYNHCNAVHLPQTGDAPPPDGYLKRIGEGNYIPLQFNAQSFAYVTMLMDPRTSVHAQTGILPLVSLGIQSKYVSPALAGMEVNFRTGPLLTDIRVAADAGSSTGGNETGGNAADGAQAGDGARSLLIPTPAEQNGTWTWLELGGTQWTEIAIAGTDAQARFAGGAPTLREGLLKLRGAISDTGDGA